MKLNLKNIQILIISIPLLLAINPSQAQKQGNNWFFGHRAGVTFNSGFPVAVSGGATTGNTNLEGTATISDTGGILLFYTDGQTVWNKNHQVMTNGTGLQGHSSATQSGVIVPHPTSLDTFFIFTIDAAHGGLNNGLRYSIVDMTLSSGLGAVTSTKNVLLSPTGVQVAEKITAIMHCNNEDIWVIAHGYGSTNGNKFYAYKINSSGIITTPVISTVGTTHNGADQGGLGNSRGYMKASPNGSKIALAITYDGCPSTNSSPRFNCATSTGCFEVFDLDYTTGVVSNPIKFSGTSGYKGAYGVEFSPDGTKLYGACWGSYGGPNIIYQWNLQAGTASQIQASRQTIATPSNPGAMQIATDRKIYIVRNGANSLAVINNPNNIGSSSNYSLNGVTLTSGTSGRYGLPTFIQSYFDPGYIIYNITYLDTTQFILSDSTRLDSVLWTFSDPSTGLSNDSRLFNPYHIFSDTGQYNIRLIMWKCNGTLVDTLYKWVIIHPRPVAVFAINDTAQCLNTNTFIFSNSSSIIDATTLSYLWDFGDGNTSTDPTPTYTYSASGTFQIKFLAISIWGGKDSMYKSVVVFPKPNPSFSINDSSQCLTDNSFTFTNNSSISSGSLTYNWNFGDANTSTSISPTHNYLSHGTYQVRLIATSNLNCKDTLIKNAYVHPMPSSTFTINDSSQCLTDNNFIFTNTSVITSGILTYNWTFGDGNSSSIPSPSNSYLAEGTYQVTLISTSGERCVDTIIKNAHVHPMPVAGFTINDSTQCLTGNSFLFSNTTTITSGTLNYTWSFGDGGFSSASNPSHSYINPNTYQVVLITSSDYLCLDTVMKNVRVHPMPIADFSIDDSSQCLVGNNFNFTNSSSISLGTLSYNWSFGDAGFSTMDHPSHSYATSNNYQVQLITSSNEGCGDTLIKNTYVRPMPNPSFTINSSTQCLASNNFIFTNTSSVSYGTMSYQWSFGDGNSSTATSPNHSYAAVGTYNVSLIITTNYGCVDSITQIVTTHPMPVADFSISNNSQCLTGNNFTFTNNSTISSGILSFQWDFDDGSSSGIVNPSHVYNTDGTFQVKLVAISGQACKDSITKNVFVRPMPTANFSINSDTQCFTSNNFILTNLSSVSSGTLSYNWNFGDGNSSSSTNPMHHYLSDGAYQIKLVVTSNYACQDSITSGVFVEPLPVTDFLINNNAQCQTANNFIFVDNSTSCDPITQYNWDLDSNGLFTDATGDSINYSFSSPGLKWVGLQIITAYDTAIIYKQVTVYPMPNVNFAINNNSQCFTANNFVFTNSSSISSGSMTYLWLFGDGNSSNLDNPTHSYLTDGNYQVTLNAVSNFGCIDSLSRNVSVHPMPFVGFTINDSSQCLTANNFLFTNTSAITSGILTYQWDLGDATTSTSAGPISYSYLSDNTYQVKLIATSAFGCQDSIVKNTYVHPMPNTTFDINDSIQCFNGHNFIFTNNTTINSGSVTYLWTFGDGGASNMDNPNYIYNIDGAYQVKLVVTSDFGCLDSLAQNVSVYPSPKAEFLVDDSSQCIVSNSYTFTNTSSITSGTITYFWDLGDGFTSTSAGPITHSYVTDNVYQARLIVTSNLGCLDSLIRDIYVNPMPDADFVINDLVQCFLQNNFIFGNLTIINSGIVNYMWDFGDGNTSNLENPSHSYTTNTDSTYTVKLVSTSGFGCQDSISKQTKVLISPTADFFIIPDSSQCLVGNIFIFRNNSTINMGTLTYEWNLGDGTTYTGWGPFVHSYLKHDTFDVKVLARSVPGCEDSIIKNVFVRPMPFAGFSINDSVQCLNGNNFIFNNTSTINSGLINNLWSFGDGDTSTLPSPNHNYLYFDTFDVKLVTTSDHDCLDSIAKTTYVHPSPLADFIIDDSLQCLTGNSYSFTNISTIPVGSLTYSWDLGDGTIITNTNVVHSYTYNDTFAVELTAISNLSCEDSMIKNTYVHPMPNVDFSINDSSQCFEANDFIFKNLATLYGFDSLVYMWDFGDLYFSLSKDARHSYYSEDTFLVELKAHSDFAGCYDTLKKKVYVHPMPIADFSINDTVQCLQNNDFIFTDNSIINSGSLVYDWNFGDGNSLTTQNPNWVYTYGDTFYVKLIAGSLIGCKDSLIKNTYVHTPVVNFAINDSMQCLKGNSFAFTNTSYTTLIDSMSSQWYFGDGVNSTTVNPNHSYSNFGTYNVKLVATTDNLACKDSLIRNIYILDNPIPGFSINDSTQCLEGNNFVLTNNSTISSGTLSYFWDFGDGDSSSSPTPNHTYINFDTFIVKLIATSDQNCKDSINKLTYVFPSPTADFTVNSNAQCINGNNFNFINTQPYQIDSLLFDWTFGDGATDIQQNTTHSYTSVDSYTVTLIVVSKEGCNDTSSQVIYTYEMPIADFSFTNTCAKDSTLFFNNSQTGSVNDKLINFLWNFGDGTEAILWGDPKHYYDTTGSYDIKLIVLSDKGCRDTITKTIDIYSIPIFSITGDTILKPGTEGFIEVNGQFGSILWNTGELTNKIIVSDSGLYTFIISDSIGCKNTGSSRVTILKDQLIIMNIITPNEDGINDYWKILNIEPYKPCKVNIYNRYGDEIYTSNDYNNDWDGKWEGKKLTEGAYYYVLKTKDDKIYKGTINLIR